MAGTLGDEVMEPTFSTDKVRALPWKWIGVAAVVAAVAGFAVGRALKKR